MKKERYVSKEQISKVRTINREHRELQANRPKVIIQAKSDEVMIKEWNGKPSVKFDDEVFEHHVERKHGALSGSSIMS